MPIAPISLKAWEEFYREATSPETQEKFNKFFGKYPNLDLLKKEANLLGIEFGAFSDFLGPFNFLMGKSRLLAITLELPNEGPKKIILVPKRYLEKEFSPLVLQVLVCSFGHEIGHIKNAQDDTVNCEYLGVACLYDEVRAWIEGFNILKKNKIKIDPRIRQKIKQDIGDASIHAQCFQGILEIKNCPRIAEAEEVIKKFFK